jgi:hypothetical protein
MHFLLVKSIKVKTTSFLCGEFSEYVKSRIFATNLKFIERVLYEKDSILDDVVNVEPFGISADAGSSDYDHQW